MPVIRQKTQAFTQSVGVTRIDSGGAQLANQISQTADRLGSIAFQRAGEEAEKLGSEIALSLDESAITTINPETGRPEPFEPPKGMGRIATEAYQRVLNKRFEDSIDRDLRLKAREIAMNNPNPNAYADVMSEYIASLSTNATGRYSEFIQSTGEAYLASTKLNLVAQERERQRRAAYAAAAQQREQAQSTAYELARAGRFEDALLVAARENAGAIDEVGAELITEDELADASSEQLGAVAAGSVVNLLDSLRGDEAARNAVIYALSTGGLGIEVVPDEYRDRVSDIAKLINGDNVRSVISEANRVSGDLAAVEASFSAIARQQEEQQARANVIAFDRGLNEYSRNLSIGLQDIFANTDPSNLPMRLSANIAANSLQVNSKLNEIDAEWQSGIIQTEAAWRRRKEETFQAFLRPYGIALAAEGSIDSLVAAIETGDPRDMNSLSSAQRTAVTAIRNTSFFLDNQDEATSYLTDIVKMGQNKARDEQAADQATFEYRMNIDNELAQMQAGGDGYDPTRANSLIEGLSGRSDFTDTQKQMMVRDINDAFSIGVANRLSGSTGMTSAQISALSEYVSSGGEVSSGLNPAIKAAGDLIIQQSGSDLSAIESHLTTLRENASRTERNRENIYEEQKLNMLVAGGGGSSNVAAHRDKAQELIESAFGVDLNTPESINPEIYSAIQEFRVVPSAMVAGIKRLTGGTLGANSEVFINHYANLSSVINSNGVTTNLFRNVLSDSEISLLDYAMTVAANSDETASQVIARTLEARSKGEFRERISQDFPSGMDDFVAEQLGADNQDPYIISRLTPVAQYMAEIGRTPDEIGEYVLQQAKDIFVESKYVFNPAMPLGNVQRSEFALEARYSEDEINQIMVIVNSELPEGYQMMNSDQINRLDADSTIKPVFFVPKPNQGLNSADYLLYTVDDMQRIVPMFVEDGDEVKWPMFTDEDLSEYRTTNGANLLEQAIQEGLRGQARRGDDKYRRMNQGVQPFISETLPFGR